MVKKTTSMSKVRQTLILHSLGIRMNKIGALIDKSNYAVELYIDK